MWYSGGGELLKPISGLEQESEIGDVAKAEAVNKHRQGEGAHATI
jgi:hypothetical protein